MLAIAQTDGHHHRRLFETSTSLTHGAVIPAHIGSPGVPRITPYSGATYAITGKRKSIEDISAYRANPNNYYSLVAHTASSGGNHSKLAGFYAIDKATNVIYFTGFSAVADLANFVEADFTLLPDLYYPMAVHLAIADLRKDGDSSAIFTDAERMGMTRLASIRNMEADQPSMAKTVGSRDSGMK